MTISVETLKFLLSSLHWVPNLVRKAISNKYIICHIKLKLKKFTQRKCKINFDMGTGKIILWHFVGQMKGAQELFKSWESSGGFRRANGWLIGIRMWGGRASRMPFRGKCDITSNKWVCGDIEIRMNYLGNWLVQLGTWSQWVESWILSLIWWVGRWIFGS